MQARLQTNATEGTAQISASRYADQAVSNISDAVVASFRGAVAAVDELSDAARNAARNLHGLGSMPGATQKLGGFTSPSSGFWVPLTSAHSGSTIK